MDGIPTGYRANVGLVLIGHDRRIFAGRRTKRRDGQTEAWQMPQGGIDRDETPVEAACRELKEEAGTGRALLLRETAQWIAYDVPFEVAPAHWKGRWRGQAQKWFALAFVGSDADIDIGSDEAEFDAWKWVTSAEMLENIVPFKRAVYETVLNEFADLIS